MQYYCRFTDSIIYYYKRFSAGMLSDYEVECRVKNGKASWILAVKSAAWRRQYSIDREEARKYIKEVEELKNG